MRPDSVRNKKKYICWFSIVKPLSLDWNDALTNKTYLFTKSIH